MEKFSYSKCTGVTFSKPPTLAQQLLNYRDIAKGEKTSKTSNKCMKCGLCGHFGGLKNMVKECSIIKCNKETIKLKKKLNCRNYGIYAAECRLCPNYYVGQTKNKFSKRWTTHRSTWNKLINNNEWRKNNNKNKEITDEKALFHHFRAYHIEKLGKDLKLLNAYELIFFRRTRL